MGQKRYLEIGKITNVHGLAGEVKVYPWCDDAAFLCSFDVLYTDKNGKNAVEIERARVQQNMVILKLKGVTDRDQAEKLRNTILYMDREDLPPFLFVHGNADRLVNYRNSVDMCEKMKSHGRDAALVTVDGQGHGFFDGDEYYEAMYAFFRKHLK